MYFSADSEFHATTLLSMSLCNTLTDNVIQRAAKIHSFRNLECLHLFHCNLITKKGIDIFLKDSNPLREIKVCSLNYHSGFTKEDLIDWNNNAIWIQKNWQFQLIFTCFYKHSYIFRRAHMGRRGTGRHNFLICLFVKFPHFNLLLSKLERCFRISLDNQITFLHFCHPFTFIQFHFPLRKPK